MDSDEMYLRLLKSTLAGEHIQLDHSIQRGHAASAAFWTRRIISHTREMLEYDHKRVLTSHQ